jgi:hypothetical protein
MENLLRILHERKGKLRSPRGAITEAVAPNGPPDFVFQGHFADGLHSALHLQRVEGRIFKPDGLDADLCPDRRHGFRHVVVPALATFAVRGKRRG